MVSSVRYNYLIYAHFKETSHNEVFIEKLFVKEDINNTLICYEYRQVV